MFQSLHDKVVSIKQNCKNFFSTQSSKTKDLKNELLHDTLFLLHSFLKGLKIFWLYFKTTAFYSRKTNRSQNFWEFFKNLCNKIEYLLQSPYFFELLKLSIGTYWQIFKYKNHTLTPLVKEDGGLRTILATNVFKC